MSENEKNNLTPIDLLGITVVCLSIVAIVWILFG